LELSTRFDLNTLLLGSSRGLTVSSCDRRARVRRALARVRVRIEGRRSILCIYLQSSDVVHGASQCMMLITVVVGAVGLIASLRERLDDACFSRRLLKSLIVRIMCSKQRRQHNPSWWSDTSPTSSDTSPVFFMGFPSYPPCSQRRALLLLGPISPPIPTAHHYLPSDSHLCIRKPVPHIQKIDQTSTIHKYQQAQHQAHPTAIKSKTPPQSESHSTPIPPLCLFAIHHRNRSGFYHRPPPRLFIYPLLFFFPLFLLFLPLPPLRLHPLSDSFVE
jgi:hypothetical protein